MTKTFTSLFLLAALVFSPSIIPAQSSSCPGVPGACGYPKNNTSAQRPSLSPMDGSGTLGNVYTVSKCGLNFTAGSVKLGQRFTPAGAPQPAAISITGLPSCDSIEKAFLWVEGSGTGASQTVTLAPPSGPAQNFPMTVIGTGPDKCWGYTGSYTYYADVTSAITGNGNYMISNVLTNPPNAGEDMDGATLLIVYCDPMGAYQGTIVIDDGAIEISGGVANYDMTYPAVCGATQNAQAFCCVGDIQMPVASLTLNGTNAPFTWDWWNYVSVGTTVSIGQTTSNFNLNTPNDCFNFCVAGLYYQTTTCATCQPSPTTLALTPTSTQASCSACDGTASVTPNPSGPYNYSWLPGGQTSQTATNLCSGSYTVTVSANCILSTATVTVSNPANLAATAAQTNVSCNAGSDGTATVSPSGGTGPYTYSWSPSGGTGPTASGLSAGLYVCTITDANGCTFQQGVIITQPAPMALNVIGTNVQCNGMNNGSAVAAVSGGSPGYSYSWSPAGGTGDTATALSPGNYSVTITDANGCSAGGSVAITEPPVLTDMITTVPVGCFGMGSATASPSGGSGSYTFQWQTGGTSATEANLTVGTYTVLITDANGCFLVDTANITSVGAITVQPSYTNISCFGNNNGTATVNSSGGNPPYSYSWSPSGGNNATATNLTPGTYTCTITDANGCTATQTFNIVQPPQITSTSAAVPVSCNGGSDGSAVMNATGGSPPFTFSWSPSGGTGQTANGLTAGIYTVTATDTSGCTTTQTVAITQPTAIVVTTTGDTACAGVNGNISVNSSGGIPPYTYLWSDGSTTPSISVSPVTSTTYTITVTDVNGCAVSGTASVFVGPNPVASFTAPAVVNGVFNLSGDPSQLCFTDGSSNAASWYWNFNSQDSAYTQDPCVNVGTSDKGTYCVTLVVHSAIGCVDTTQECIEINDVNYSIPNVFTPNGDGSNDAFIITNSGMASLHCEIYDRWGALIYEWNDPAGYWDGKTNNGKEAVDGVYYYVLYMADYTGKNYNETGFVHLIRGTQK